MHKMTNLTVANYTDGSAELLRVAFSEGVVSRVLCRDGRDGLGCVCVVCV